MLPATFEPARIRGSAARPIAPPTAAPSSALPARSTNPSPCPAPEIPPYRAPVAALLIRRAPVPAPLTTRAAGRRPPPLIPAPVEVAESDPRSEEHTSELQSLMHISYAVFCFKK